MNYFLIAGEASGDLLGASLMKGILAKDSDAKFQYWGGDLMAAEAPGLVQHFKEINIMGFVEVLLKLNTIKKNLARCKEQILRFKPDVLILIDYPGFNLRMAKFAKENGFKTTYFIAPKIWAWNEKRGYQLEKHIDLLLLIFPFEIDYFKKWKVNSTYVGNPLFEQTLQFIPDPNFRFKHNLADAPLIALLPGSRKQEIKRMLPKMLELAKQYPNYKFLIAGAPGLNRDFYEQFLDTNIELVFDATRDILSYSTAAIVCSGTATLETAFMNTPQVCAYAAHPISYNIAITFVKVKYISLVNLNVDKLIIPELIQHDYTLPKLKAELEAILPGGSKREQMLSDYKELHQKFGHLPSGKLAADAIWKLLQA
jgi:lipid-A-disaccharide synthase